MRWPWVARELLDSERSATERLLAHHQRENARLAALVDALRTELHDVTARAMTPPVVAVPPTVAPLPAEPDPIRDAIREESNGDPRLAAYFWKRAGELRRADPQMPPRQVADTLRTWESVGDPFDPAQFSDRASSGVPT